MPRSLSALLAATATSLAVVPAAEGHSLIRVIESDALYLSQDATSLNTLTVRSVGNEIEFRDPTVDGAPTLARAGRVTSALTAIRSKPSALLRG